MTELKNQTGQVVVILLLVIVVALGVGLSVVGRSVTEISTSSKTEDSSKAFSAAEAGLERAIINPVPTGFIGAGDLTNQASANYNAQTSLPPAQTAIEYPPYGKESFAQFWLANPDGTPPSSYYTQSSFDLYFGTSQDYTSSPDDQPAVEVQVVSYNGSVYSNWRGFYDSYNKRAIDNHFTTCSEPNPTQSIVTNYAGNSGRVFYCRVRISGYGATSPVYPVMVRVRLLYTRSSHPVALQPLNLGACTSPYTACSLPPQLKIYTSTGMAGSTQRKLQLFQMQNVIPDLFGYGLFSAGDLSK